MSSSASCRRWANVTVASPVRMAWLDASIPSATACSSSRCPAAVQLVPFALEFSQVDDLGQAGVQLSLPLPLWLAQGLADGRLPGLELLGQPGPAAGPGQRAGDLGGIGPAGTGSQPGAAAGPPGGSQCRTGRPQIPPSALISSTAIWARFPVAAANTLPGPDLPVGLPSGWLSAGSSSAPTNHAVASATAGPRPSAPRPVLLRHLCLGQFEGCPVRDEGDVLVHRVQRLGAGEKHGERLVVCKPVQPRSDLP